MATVGQADIREDDVPQADEIDLVPEEGDLVPERKKIGLRKGK